MPRDGDKLTSSTCGIGKDAILRLVREFGDSVTGGGKVLQKDVVFVETLIS